MTHNQYADSELYLFVKSAAGEIIAQQTIPNTGAYLPIEMTFTIPSDGDYTIGIYANAISEDWAVFDMARLGYCGVPPFEPETPTTPDQSKPSEPAPAPSQPETPAATDTTQNTAPGTEPNTTTAAPAALESSTKSELSSKPASAIPATGDPFPVTVLTLLAVASAGMFLILRKNAK